MDPHDVQRVAEWIRSSIGVQFIVVGGSAIERIVPVATKDVDVLIDESDWAKIDAAIESREEAAPLEPFGGTIRGTIVAIGGASIDLEFLSDSTFNGTREPGSFLRYVREQGSIDFDGVRYAKPAVVFYMRLNAPESWESYVPSIERDIQSGVTPSELEGAIEIANRFGVGARTTQRVAFVRSLIG
jgi:hypothetical protein